MKELSPIEKRARSITNWVGSPQSIIIHTLIFFGAFFLAFLGLIPFDRMLLVLTTMVSLEAIYLAIFIQMTINHQSEVIAEVEQGLDEIQEDVDEIQEDIEGIQEDVEEIGEDLEEIQEDVDEIGEDFDEMSEDKVEERRKREQKQTLENIYETIKKLAGDIAELKK